MFTSSFNKEHYQFALSKRVFPIFDVEPDYWSEVLEFDESPDPIVVDWLAPPWAMQSYFEQLLAANSSSPVRSFYQFERDQYKCPWTNSLNRDCMYGAFRYFYMKGIFEQYFWSEFCRRGEAPMEALDIISRKVNL